MTYLKNIRQTIVKKRVILALFFGSLALLTPIFLPNVYGYLLALTYTLISIFLGFYVNKINKDFGGDFSDSVCLSDSVGIKLNDKDIDVIQIKTRLS